MLKITEIEEDQGMAKINDVMSGPVDDMVYIVQKAIFDEDPKKKEEKE